MRLFLVRHGETVDNVAGVYAGIRDSPLTVHGVLQARRLGTHFADRLKITHIFSSDLQRAVQTAQAVVDGQSKSNEDSDKSALELVQLTVLREQDFGSAEGKRFGTPHADAETHEQMRARAARFVQGHLVPLLEGSGGKEPVVVVVAHGLILNSLFRVLSARFRAWTNNSQRRLEPSASWSNTGYLEAILKKDTPEGDAAEPSGDRKPEQPRTVMSVVGVNVLQHLEGLKKTRGGIGSAKFDKRQRTMVSFFGPASKKPRVEKEES
ncbi:putative phosphoglycerate mutase [Podospora fimiseda]|uniref:Phosphoglycerate mutase n=1 Tax=Podospora fimiseda TaxID=252190 RepID=A0AAN7BM44_9PEZI|nr:putative phosphoglycerate mutase [Podospora fimiseda]